MKVIRTHMSMFYDELWADLTYNQTGKVVKTFQDRHAFGKASLEDGFIKQKPKEFNEIDNLITDIFYFDVNMGTIREYISNITVLSDNRMMMGDYRYGFILRQNLDNYDVVKEFHRRIQVAVETENLEYICDAYNMIRIQYFKSKDINSVEDLINMLCLLIIKAFKNNWPLQSIDDGIHAEEK